MAKPDISIVAAGLTDRIENLVAELLPNGKKHGHEWRCGSLAGEPGQSMAVNIGTSRPGVWQDFSSLDNKGDAFDLVAKCLFAGDKRRALAWSISWLGLDDMDPGRIKKNQRDIEERKKEREQESRAERMKTRKYARKIWLDAEPDIYDTPVYHYLLGRGIDLKKLDYQPRSIRFAKSLKEPTTGKEFPAMVTAINGVQGNFAAVHRTFLQIEADGRVVKADVPNSKMVLASFKGGCIRLWRGEDVNPETGEIKRGQPWGKIKNPCCLTITEGIEDGLTIALVSPDRRIAVSVTLSHLALMMIPECFTDILIVGDNDPAESQASATLKKAITTFQRQGRKVFLSLAPEGFKDVNDMLTGSHVHGG